QLRERVALAGKLAADATFLDVALLADAVDVYVDRTVILRTAEQARVAARVLREHHAGNGIGKFEEVARNLRNRLDRVQRHRAADLGCLDVRQRGGGDRYA